MEQRMLQPVNSIASLTFTGDAIGKIIPNQSNLSQIRVITLNSGQHLESSLFIVEKGWIIVFQLGPSLFGKDISLYTNHPPSASIEFEREKYYLLQWNKGIENRFKDDVGVYASLPIRRAGSYNYYFEEKTEASVKTLGSGHFTVNPVLTVGRNDENILFLNSIQCQTVLAKSLGLFSDWKGRLRVSKESGYTMIHFTPVQELGGSNSSYCLKDQLRLNPKFGSSKSPVSYDDLAKLTNELKEEWEVLCISDVVLNHTANESPWLAEHPECTYNMITAPYLTPAAILDGYLYVFGKQVGKGLLTHKGIPSEVSTEEHLQAIKFYLETELVPNLRLSEFYTCDVDELSAKFRKLAESSEPTNDAGNLDDLRLITDSFSGRKKAVVDMKLAVRIFNRKSSSSADENMRIFDCVENFKNHLHEMNARSVSRINEHLTAAVNNCIASIRYFRVQANGPKIREISVKDPLIPRYFTGNFSDYESVEKEVFKTGEYVMAHNGWVMDFDPLKNFASCDSNVYLRRELIPWGDSVKLRYGNSREDCPFLWDHMREYVEKSAETFHGIRLDNCHSTPLPAAEYLLDCARKVRPDLYIAAELFTNSDETDNIFINRLGITSLIREAMSAWNAHELGRLVYRFGGEPVGDFFASPVRPLVPSVAHALFYDVTHDNESLIEKRSVFDSLPCAAVVNMACCATGSTRGFDELVPHHIHVVDEERLYTSWTNDENTEPREVNSESGIISVKKRLNLLHKKLSDEGFSQVYVDQMNENIIAITRHNPLTHDSVILVVYTAFSYPTDGEEDHEQIKKLEVEGMFSEILFEASLYYNGEGSRFSKPKDFAKNKDYINGLLNYKVSIKENVEVEESRMLKKVSVSDSKFSRYEFTNFSPGSVVVVKVCQRPEVRPKVEHMINLIGQLEQGKCMKLIDISTKLTLEDLNFALYRCSEEDVEEGFGSYNIPKYGSLVYCGLQGFSSLLQDIRFSKDLGHPFCENLRQGNWMLDYISGRLKGEEGTRQLGLWFEETFEALQHLPRYLIPRYFDVVVISVANLLLSSAAFQMSEFVRNGSTFVRALAMGSVQCVGSVKSAPLPSFSPLNRFSNPRVKEMTMCAGLPHFTTGCMRSWGRDTFISLRGLLLLCGRYEVARCHILGYASCLRHGLIPNLLDGGKNPRYNCRDAVWWWLYSITSYIKLAPDGSEILTAPVSRIFPKDDSSPLGAGLADQPLYSIMQEALTIHFQGLSYREKNAGPGIDAHMTDEGFNNRIGVELSTGFVYGGNEYNCGTWMDKMGSSAMAGNRGRPATPRDGSAVELVGLCKAVLRELSELHGKGLYPYDSVRRSTDEGVVVWKFKEWEEKISSNFDNHFWIDALPNSEKKESNLIHRRGIYKDSYGATQPWADYQLRCNFLITLAVAPEITDPTRAWTAIGKAEEILLGPLGIKTLDPADWNYNGNYNNDENSDNPKVAHGFNYHQGPEWLWPVGFFLRAKLHFAKLRGPEELKRCVKETLSYLGGFYNSMMTSHWKGLPELTNENGAYCSHGCRVQAWSMACIMEVLYDIYQLEID